MTSLENYTVIGAGHGGKAMAAHLSLLGCNVPLYNRTFEHVEAISKRGGLDLECAEGGPHGFATIDRVTSDMAVALEKAQVVMVVVPSSAHGELARKMAR